MSKIDDILEKIDELEVRRLNLQLNINEIVENRRHYNPYNGDNYRHDYDVTMITSYENEQRIIDVDITRLKIDYLFEEKVNEIKSIKNRINV